VLNRQQTEQYLTLYNSNPWLFDDDKVDLLDQSATLHELPFQRNVAVEEKKQDNLLNQFTSGVSEGFTTLGWADDPVSESGALANSMGHLIGLAPALLGGGLTKGAGALVKIGLGQSKVTQALGNAGRFLQSPVAKSLPFRGSEFINKKYVNPLLKKAGVDVMKFAKEGSVPADMMESALNLGFASGLGSWKDGIGAVTESTLHGAMFGGAFGAIGNVTRMGKLLGHKNPKVRSGAEDWWFDKVVRGGIGASLQGGLAVAQDAPTSMQIYEFILGGFFGATHVNAKVKAGRNYTNSFYNKENEAYGTKNFGKESEMLKTDDFKILDPLSKEVVKDHFINHIGEKYNRQQGQLDLFHEKVNEDVEPTEASVYFKNLKARAERTRLLEEESLLKGKKELSPEDKAQAQAKASDLIQETIETGQDYVLAREVADYVTTEKKGKAELDKLSDPAKEVLKELEKSPESLKQAEGGNAETIWDIIRGNKPNTKESIEAKDFLSEKPSDQLETDNMSVYIREPLREIEKSLKGKEDQFQIMTNLVNALNNSKQPTYESFIEKVREFNEDYIPSDKVERALRQYYNRYENEELRPYIYFTKQGAIGRRDVYNSKGERVKETNVKPSDEEHFVNEGLFSKNARVLEFKDFEANGDIFKPYDQIYDMETGEFNPVMEGKDWVSIGKKLDKRGEYLKIPKKDNGVERIYPYHKQVLLSEKTGKLENLWRDTLKRFEKIAEDSPFSAEDMIEKNIKDWLEFHGANEKTPEKIQEKQELINQYKKSMISNFLYEPHAQFGNVMKRVKYESLLASKGMPQKMLDKFTDIVPNGELEFIVVDDMPSGNHKTNTEGIPHSSYKERGKPNKINYESEIDGYLVLHSKLFDRILEANGMDPSTSRLKPSIAAWINGQLFLVKGGVHPSQKEYDNSLGGTNRIMVMTSASKIVPKGTDVYHPYSRKNKQGEVVFEFKAKNKNGKGSKKTVKADQLKGLKIKLSDLRIDYGVREDSHALESQTIKKQFHSMLNALQIPKQAFNDFMSQAFDKGIEGNKDANGVVDSIVKNPKMPIPKNFRINEIGDQKFLEIYNNPDHPLFKELLKDMVRVTKHREQSDSFGEEQNLIEINEYINELQRWAKYNDFDPVTAYAKPELYEAMALRYRKQRFMYPKWKHSASGWVAGNDPVTKLRHGKVERGHFKLGLEYKNMRVKWKDTESEVTLEHAWKKLNSKLTTPFEKRLIQDSLEFALMRVPSPAVSGTRMLKFGGFIENTAQMKDHGIYMHPKDHFYIDGADVDGDKVFIYQGLPQSFRKAIRKERNELSVGGKGKEMLPNKDKSEKVNTEFKSTYPDEITKQTYTTKLSQYMPMALRKAGMGAYQGKNSMGVVVNAKTFLNYTTADVINTHKGEAVLEVFHKKYKNGNLVLRTDKKTLNHPDTGYRKYAVEASSRTADSSEYWNILNSKEMTELLFNKAFPNAQFVFNKPTMVDGKKVKSIPATFDMLKKSDYGSLYEVNQKLFGKDYLHGRAWSVSEVQKAMKDASSTQFRMNSLFYLANKLGAGEMVTHKAMGSKAWRNTVKEFNKVVNDKDKGILRYLNRKKLKVTPRYFDTDRKRGDIYVESFYAEGGRGFEKNLPSLSLDQILARGFMESNPQTAKRIKAENKLHPLERKLFEELKDKGIVTPMNPQMESKLVFNDVMDMYSAVVGYQKGKPLVEALMKSGMNEDSAYEYLNTLAVRAQNIKTKHNKGRLGNKDRSVVGADKTAEDTNISIKEIKKRIRNEADFNKIDRGLALDYFYNSMLGSLYNQSHSPQVLREAMETEVKRLEKKINETESVYNAEKKRSSKQVNTYDENNLKYFKNRLANFGKFYNKTSFNRYPLETTEIPESVKKEFIGNHAKFWHKVHGDTNKGKSKSFTQLSKMVADNLVPETVKKGEGKSKIQKKVEIKANLERLTGKSFADTPISNISKKNTPKDIPKILKQLEEDFAALPYENTQFMEERFAEFQYENKGIVKPISQATYEDLRGFSRYIRQIRIEGSKTSRMRKIYQYLFPERVGDKQLVHDSSQMYKKQVIYQDKKGQVSLLDIRVPFSTMSYLSESFGKAYTMENMQKNMNQEEIQNFYDIREQILGTENGTTDFAKLHRIAVAKMLHDNVEKHGSIETQQQRNAQHLKIWQEHQKDMKEFVDKKYKITEGGKEVIKTGSEVVEWIQNKHGEFFNKFYKKWITADSIRWRDIDENRMYKKYDELIEFLPNGALNMKRIRNVLLKPTAFGQEQHIQRLINNTSLSADTLYRIQYEVNLENVILAKNINPNSEQAKRYRERARIRYDKDGNWRNSAFKPTGYVGNKKSKRSDMFTYFPQMMHMETKKSRREVREFITEQMKIMSEKATDFVKALKEDENTNIDDYGIRKSIARDLESSIDQFKKGIIPEKTLIDRFLAKQEEGFEIYLGNRANGEDGGAGEHALRWLNANSKDTTNTDKTGFNQRPGSGKSRGDVSMPGFSLDFEVVDAYSNQWISSFYKNLTAIVAHDRITDFSKKNPLKNQDNNDEWENFMRMYTRDVLGFPSTFNSEMIGLHKDVLKRYQDQVKNYEGLSDRIQMEMGNEKYQEIQELKEVIRKDKQRRKIRSTASYWLSDEVAGDFILKVAKKLGSEEKPKLPSFEDGIIPKLIELPKSPDAQKFVIRKLISKIGAFEAKVSLINLLSHPKTAIGNLLGGNANTISNNGLRHFIKAKDTTHLYSIFKGASLKDGTKITPDNVKQWTNRFAEESGALESFIVSEASLERSFGGKKAKGFLREFIDEYRKDSNMPDSTLYDIAKKHGFNKAVVDTGAWFMRKSERSLRRDSFISHYLSARETLSQVIPDLKFDNPFIIKQAVKGVEATQFLYHGSVRPAFSRTSTGKIFTRFMPFAWNSIKFRRLAWTRAKVHGFDINSQTGKRLQRQLTADMLVFALGQIFVSSIFDSALPPPMSYMQDTADWLFGDEKTRERAFFNQWPHPALAPLSTVTGPSMRFILGPTKALINQDWEPFLNYHAWTWAPFGRLARSVVRTYDRPEMWVEEMSGIPIHRLAKKMKKNKEEDGEQME
jgi:hypothetical protein